MRSSSIGPRHAIGCFGSAASGSLGGGLETQRRVDEGGGCYIDQSGEGEREKGRKVAMDSFGAARRFHREDF